MRFVYATRPLPKLEFAIASQREAIPEEAEVFAVCDGAMTIRQHDEQSFSTLTDQEQSALEELIIESQISEANTVVTNGQARFVGRRLRRLLNIWALPFAARASTPSGRCESKRTRGGPRLSTRLNQGGNEQAGMPVCPGKNAWTCSAAFGSSSLILGRS